MGVVFDTYIGQAQPVRILKEQFTKMIKELSGVYFTEPFALLTGDIEKISPVYNDLNFENGSYDDNNVKVEYFGSYNNKFKSVIDAVYNTEDICIIFKDFSKENHPYESKDYSDEWGWGEVGIAIFSLLQPSKLVIVNAYDENDGSESLKDQYNYLYTSGKDAPMSEELVNSPLSKVLQKYLGELEYAMGAF